MELEPWVWWTLLAAMMQAVRTAGQKQLTAAVTPLAATLVRYLFGLPFALLWLTYAGATLNFDFPDLNLTFLVSGLIAGILQIVATLLLVRLLTLRNFAVGTTFVKSEIYSQRSSAISFSQRLFRRLVGLRSSFALLVYLSSVTRKPGEWPASGINRLFMVWALG